MSGTEVGTAWVTVVPSAKGFARQLQKDIAKEFANSRLDVMIADALANVRISVPVEPVINLDDLENQLERLSDETDALEAVDVPVNADADDLTEQIAAVIDQAEAIVRAEVPTVAAGAEAYTQDLHRVVAAAEALVEANIPTKADTSGVVDEVERAALLAEQTTDIDLNVDVDQERIGALGGTVGKTVSAGVERSLFDKLPDAISGPIGAIANNPIVSTVVGTVGIFVGLALASAIGAALAGAITGAAGLGVIGAGFLAVKDDPRIKQAGAELKDKFTSTFKDAAEPLVEPFVDAMGQIEQLLTDIGPDLREMFEVFSTPDENGTTVISALTEAFTGLVKGALPGFIDLVKASGPLLKDLASTLPRFGEDIGEFFTIIGTAGPGASQIIRDLLNIVGLGILAVGVFIAAMTQQYMFYRGIVEWMLGALQDAGEWVAGAAEDIGDHFKRLGMFIAGVWKAIRTDTDGFISFVTGIPGRILRGLGNFGTLLRNAGMSLIRGLIDGVQAMFGPLGSALGGVTRFITDHKGPPEKDRVLLEPAGRAIMGGLIRGIHGERAALEAELGSVTSVVAGTPLTSPALAGGYAAMGGLAPAGVEARWAPDATGDQLLDALRQLISFRYAGSPDAALGSGG